MKFKKSFTCDVCGTEITYPNFRIEWGYNTLSPERVPKSYEFIQVCHNDCSYGIQNDDNNPTTCGDIIFDQLSYTPEHTYNRLSELSKTDPLLKNKISEIKNNIFEKS